MATTTAFGWSTPDDTSLVKDGAAAIRTLGSSIDTSMAELKGGTTGQVLSKTSNTDMDFTWVAQDDTNAIQNAIVDAKGDLIAATANDTPARLAVGANNTVLTADSSTATGLKWSATASGMTLITRTSFSNQATVNIDSIFSSTYKSYLFVIEDVAAATIADDLIMLMRYSTTTQTSGYYGNQIYTIYSSTSLGAVLAVNNATSFTLNNNCAGVSSQIWFNRVGNSSQAPNWQGSSTDYQAATNFTFYGNTSAQTYTGVQLKSSSTNITGTVSVYGLAVA